jgi:hypothetical protein
MTAIKKHSDWLVMAGSGLFRISPKAAVRLIFPSLSNACFMAICISAAFGQFLPFATDRYQAVKFTK